MTDVERRREDMARIVRGVIVEALKDELVGELITKEAWERAETKDDVAAMESDLRRIIRLIDPLALEGP